MGLLFAFFGLLGAGAGIAGLSRSDDGASLVGALQPLLTPVSATSHTRQQCTSFLRMLLTAGALK
ncbi:MAG: hypothetical protein ABJI43_23935 [Roseobacter sp.]|uniref:hypothetical protein n=1 Tax=Yoonia sp. TaxID=2212373 RepID=UPI003299000C